MIGIIDNASSGGWVGLGCRLSPNQASYTSINYLRQQEGA